MASKLYHEVCPDCNGVIEAGEGFLYGLDLGQFPPTSLYAHRTCYLARPRRGFVILRGDTPSPCPPHYERTLRGCVPRGEGSEAETLPLFAAVR